MVQANDVVRPMSRHSERSPLVLGGTQLHGETVKYVFITGICFLKTSSCLWPLQEIKLFLAESLSWEINCFKH